MTLAQLQKKKQQLEERLQKAKDKSTQKFANLGWGTGMRHSKIRVSFQQEDLLQAQLDAVNKQIKQLQDP